MTSVFYVSAHSKIPKKTKPNFSEINSIPENTYIIMKASCGEYSWLDDSGFVEKYLTTPEGVQYLQNVVLKSNQISIDGKRIYRPGEIGPINQVLNFKQRENNFFLGVNIAPLNVQKTKNNMKEKVFLLSRTFFEDFYKNFHYVYKTRFDNLNEEGTGFEEDPSVFKDKEDLVFNLMDMMSTYGGSLDLMSYYQFEKLLTDEQYFKNFIDKKIKINNSSQTIKISDLMSSKGPAIYVIDTCRAYRKVTFVKDILRVEGSKKKGFGALSVRRSDMKKSLSKLNPQTCAKYEERLLNALKTIPTLSMIEQTRRELI